MDDNKGTVATIEIPESLLKKKCHCGKLLKNFFVGATPMPPEWLAFGLYERALTKEAPPIVQGDGMTDMLAMIMFFSTCSECGNITFWMLENDEIKYMKSSDGISSGYKLAWMYSPKFVKNNYLDYPDAVKQRMFEIVDGVEKYRTGEGDENEE